VQVDDEVDKTCRTLCGGNRYCVAVQRSLQTGIASFQTGERRMMLTVHIRIGDMAFIECKARIVRSETAFRLREAVISQGSVRTMVLDLTEVQPSKALA
jgi:hypothetical protein